MIDNVRFPRSTRAVLGAAVLVAAALPGAVAAETCKSDQFDRGGTCTSFTAAAEQAVAIARSTMTERDARGVILRIDIGGHTLVNRGLGDSLEGVPASPAMHFRPGSMAIPMLTTLALQLQDQRKLDLDDTLSRWYPQYPDADKVTLRMLASSTSGYPDYIQGNDAFQKAQLADVFRHWTDDELLSYAFALPPVCAPGTCFHYAHTNFVLFGRVLEKVVGQMVEKTFIRPLRLHHTRITKQPDMSAPFLHAYSRERGVYEDSSFWSPSWGLGDGLIMTTTAQDMATMIHAIGNGRFISDSARQELVAPLSRGLENAPKVVDYALGLAVGQGWMLQNPQFNGYQGILGYHSGRKISIVVENTLGPQADGTKSISASIFGALTRYLTPDSGIDL